MIPIACGLAIFGNAQRKRWRAIEAYEAISSKGVDAHFANGLDHVIQFKNKNVTDDDLAAFTPAFNGSAPSGFGTITGLELNGSAVSAEAVERFKRAVPQCQARR